MIRLSKSVIGVREVEAVRTILERGFLGMGQEVQRFEQELSDFLGGMGVACVNTGTSALHLALQALGVGPGDEVLVPSLTYVASFQAISATGATPVACDVSINDGLMDVRDAGRRVTPRTKAIMPVYYASNMGDLDAMYAFARERRLRVIEDAAHAFGCEYAGKRIGSFGDVVCFSFDGIKNITSGEGGAVVTRDAAVLARVQDARLLGVEKDTEKRYQGQRSWEFEVHGQGWRYHMSEIMAAIGRVQLQRLETEFKPKRMSLAKRYRDHLARVAGIELLDSGPGTVIPHIFPIRVLDGKRDRVWAALLEQEIQAGLHYKPNHLLAKYRVSAPLPCSERLYSELLTLPLHPEISDQQVDLIVETVRGVVESVEVG